MNNVTSILSILKDLYPNAKCELNATNDWQLLIVVILSAQTTDKKVNEVSKKLFSKYQTLDQLANANITEIEKIINTLGLYRTKAKNIKMTATILLEHYNGKVPNTMKDLLSLPGVGRKTANVVLAELWGITDGIVVDTHVARLSKRFGWTQNKEANKIEKDLMKIIPKPEWKILSHLLITHGRTLCKAQKPLCNKCKLKEICQYFLNTIKKH